VRAIQTCTVPSTLPVASRCSSGLNATEVTTPLSQDMAEVRGAQHGPQGIIDLIQHVALMPRIEKKRLACQQRTPLISVLIVLAQGLGRQRLGNGKMTKPGRFCSPCVCSLLIRPCQECITRCRLLLSPRPTCGPNGHESHHSQPDGPPAQVHRRPGLLLSPLLLRCRQRLRLCEFPPLTRLLRFRFAHLPCIASIEKLPFQVVQVRVMLSPPLVGLGEAHPRNSAPSSRCMRSPPARPR
jgi:hypothetical protein